MIIPIRCFTCNSIIANKYECFLEKKAQIVINKDDGIIDTNSIKEGKIKKSPIGDILDSLNVHRYCCRRMFLGQVDLIDVTS